MRKVIYNMKVYTSTQPIQPNLLSIWKTFKPLPYAWAHAILVRLVYDSSSKDKDFVNGPKTQLSFEFYYERVMLLMCIFSCQLCGL